MPTCANFFLYPWSIKLLISAPTLQRRHFCPCYTVENLRLREAEWPFRLTDDSQCTRRELHAASHLGQGREMHPYPSKLKLMFSAWKDAVKLTSSSDWPAGTPHPDGSRLMEPEPTVSRVIFQAWISAHLHCIRRLFLQILSLSVFP